MTLAGLRKHVAPATVEIDRSGCVELLAPKGQCFDWGLHILVTDPAMCGYPKANNLYTMVRMDFDTHPLQPCPDRCHCKED